LAKAAGAICMQNWITVLPYLSKYLTRLAAQEREKRVVGKDGIEGLSSCVL